MGRIARIAWILLGCALAWWFAFDRVWPRVPAGLFARVELGLLAAACGVGVVAWRRERTAQAKAALGVALAGLGLSLVVAVLRLRYVP